MSSFERNEKPQITLFRHQIISAFTLSILVAQESSVVCEQLIWVESLLLLQTQILLLRVAVAVIVLIPPKLVVHKQHLILVPPIQTV